LAYGLYRLIEWPGFRLRHTVVQGAQATSRADVIARAAFGAHPNMWLVDLGAARRRIEALPYVRNASLIRVPPATISIAIVERVPVGCLEGLGYAEALVDVEGRVLSDVCPDTAAPIYRMPIAIPAPGGYVRDPGLAQLLSDAAALRGAGQRFVELRHDRFGQLEATLTGGVVVRFGDETQLAAKSRLVGPILTTAAQQLGPVESIDLRAPATPVVRYRGAAGSAVSTKQW
jgi:cell division protein FtsQ